MLLESIFLLTLGLVFGSFISALTWRVPRGMSFVKGRSICPRCKSQIAWYDNIPLFSYLALAGKCRNCKTGISLRYPIVELATALGFVTIGYFSSTLQGSPLQGVYSVLTLIYFLVVFIILFAIFIIDLENQIIPDSLVFSGIFIVLSYSLFIIPNSLFSIIFSGFLAASFLMLLHLITKGKGMGLGDVKFAVLGGILINLKLLPIWFLLAFLTGAIAGSILILLGRAKMKSKIAFGPFLIIGLGLAVVFGKNITHFLGLI